MKTPLPFILLPFVFFVVAPAFLLKQNPQDLGDLDPRAFLLLLLAAGGGTIGLNALRAVLSAVPLRLPRRRPVDLGRAFDTVVDFGLFLIVSTAFVLPLARRSGMVDPWRVPIHFGNVVLALGAAAILTRLASSPKVRKPLLEVLVLFVAANALTTVPALLSLRSTRAMPGLSSSRNILVLSLDGISGSVAGEVLAENPDLAAKFRGFTVFDRVASSSPATSASIAASLYGNRDFKAEFPKAAELSEAAPERLLTNQLNAHGYRVATYGMYNEGFQDPSGTHTKLARRDPPSVLELLNYSIARTLTSAFVVQGGPFEWLDREITRKLSTVNAADADLMRRFTDSSAPSWKTGRLTPTLLDFREYVATLRAATTSPIAHFLHFTHTHFPVEFDRDCRFRGDEPAWFAARQDRSGVKEETYCAIAQYAMFVDKIRALGLFEESLIILKSDHGTPVEYNDPGSIESFRIRGDATLGVGRYRPFLAIKDFGDTAQDLTHDGNPVLLDDLARTLCLRSGAGLDCARYNGFDLIGRDFSGIEQARVTLFVVRRGNTDYRYESHDPISFARGRDIVTNLHRALSEEILKADLPCGRDVQVKAAPALDNGHSDREHWLSWKDGRVAFLRFRLARPCGAVDLILAASEGASARPVVVRINGVPLEAAVGAPQKDGTLRVSLAEGLVGTARDVVVEVGFEDAATVAPPEILGLHLGGA